MRRLAIAATAATLGGGAALYQCLKVDVGQVADWLRHDFCVSCNDGHTAVTIKSC